MKTIRNLCRLWSTFTRSCRIISPSITAHEIDFWMQNHPSFCGFCFAIRQEVNHLVALHVYQDRAEFSPTTESKIIYSQLRHLSDRLCRQRHDAPENGQSGGLYP